MWLQITALAVVAVVFVVRLAFALTDRPTKPHN
ncbi:hypothetical protein EV193_10549 [Herbihabitans rhizosphaerae]|uniref:Uncharacterized protein n=1 Tax=Herbihabitans rhizosphaerae TaxID=1872711 RepID=A0A4Q7KMG0_9PSEU|nr:hypothetical protein EV193_10549 [Herbihabitans rhizosphaerae]